MKLNMPEDKKNPEILVGDILIIKGHESHQFLVSEILKGGAFAGISFNLVSIDGKETFTAHRDSLSDLIDYVIRTYGIAKHFSQDEYELTLTKKEN